jgi:predicted PurR-regulated permease PerM
MIESKKHIILQQENPPVKEIKFSARAKLITVAVLVGLVVLYLLHVWEALAPFIWAAVTAFIFNGLLKRLSARFGGPRWAWAAGVYLTFLVILGIALALMIPAISKEAKTLATDSPMIKQSVDDYLNNNPTINIVGVDVQSETLRNGLNNVLDRLPALAQELGPGLVSKTFRFVVDLLLYLIATFYLMLIGGRAIWQFISTLPLNLRSEMRHLVTRADTVLGAYIKGQFLLVIIMSVASFIFLSIMGIRYALLLGIMTGILELIPFVGPYLAITVCSLVAFFQPHGPKVSFGLDSVTLVIIVIIGLFILRHL